MPNNGSNQVDESIDPNRSLSVRHPATFCPVYFVHCTNNLRAANVLSLSRSRPCSAFELRSRLTDWRTAPHRRIQCVRCARNLWDYRSLSDRCAGVGAVVERVSAAAGSSMRTIVAKFRQSMPFFVLSCWTAAFQSYKGCCCCCCCRWV